MKVFLGNAPWYREGFYGVRAGSRWPHFERNESCYMPFPFFLAYATALLEQDGHHVFAVDGIAERMSEQEFYRKIRGYQPEVVILEVSTASMKTDLRQCREIRQIIGRDAKLIICGVDTNIYQPSFLTEHHDIDYVLKGEYEYTLRELIRTLATAQQSIAKVQGLLYRESTGQGAYTGDRPLIEDLDSLPWPNRHFFPMEKYNDTPGDIPTPSVQMWASRGCPYHCIFCAWPQIIYGGSNYRTRDPVKVIDELEFLITKCGFKSVYFDDDTFNIGKPRILALCDEMRRRSIRIPWAIMARADTMDKEMLEAMADRGLRALKYGVESGDQGILDNCGKNLKLDKVREAVAFTKNLGINIHLTFTFGLPGETKETARKTIDLAQELDPDTLQFSIITPFPGSKYYSMLEEKGFLLSKDWSKYDGYTSAVLKTDAMTPDDLEEALNTANRTWERHTLHKRLRKHSPVELLKESVRNPKKVYSKLKVLLR